MIESSSENTADWPIFGLADDVRPSLAALLQSGERAALATLGRFSLLFVPVFNTTGSSSRGGITPIGLLTVRISLSAAIDAIVAALEPVPRGIDLYVLDDAAPAGQRLIYDHPSQADLADSAVRNETKALVEPYWGASFSFAGRDFTTIVRATPQLLAEKLAGLRLVLGGPLGNVFFGDALAQQIARRVSKCAADQSSAG